MRPINVNAKQLNVQLKRWYTLK